MENKQNSSPTHTSTQRSDGLLSKAELSDYLGISPRTLHNWMTARRIPFFRLGGRILFDLDKVMQALASYEVKSLRM